MLIASFWKLTTGKLNSSLVTVAPGARVTLDAPPERQLLVAADDDRRTALLRADPDLREGHRQNAEAIGQLKAQGVAADARRMISRRVCVPGG